MRQLAVRRFGLVPYADALALQRLLVEDRRAERIPDTLLLLQHPHVVTMGVRRTGQGHILATSERLAELGVEVVETTRGGDVTYHGPGQIVGYPILDLRPDRQDVHRYVRDLEEVMIRVCAELGLAAGRLPGCTGTWIAPASSSTGAGQAAWGQTAKKVGAIGVRISRWITSHGFAFNVNTDLEFFRLIVPCGLVGREVTSLRALMGREMPLAEVEALFVRHFAAIFERDTFSASLEPLVAS